MAIQPVYGTPVSVTVDDELSDVRWVSLPEALLLPGMFGPVNGHLHRALN